VLDKEVGAAVTKKSLRKRSLRKVEKTTGGLSKNKQKRGILGNHLKDSPGKGEGRHPQKDKPPSKKPKKTVSKAQKSGGGGAGGTDETKENVRKEAGATPRRKKACLPVSKQPTPKRKTRGGRSAKVAG